MPLVIPIFIPHQGCPQQCLFCNQHSITGEREGRVDVAMQVAATIREWLLRPRRQAQARDAQVSDPAGRLRVLPVPQVQVATVGPARSLPSRG